MHKLPNLASCSFDSSDRVLQVFSGDGAWCIGMSSIENGKQASLCPTTHLSLVCTASKFAQLRGHLDLEHC